MSPFDILNPYPYILKGEIFLHKPQLTISAVVVKIFSQQFDLINCKCKYGVTRVQYRSGLYSVQCASVQCTVTHFPETLASPRCLGQHSRQPGSARAGTVSWPRAGPRLGKFGEFGHLQLPASGGGESVSHSQTWSGIQEYFAGTGEIASAQEEPGY